jgi:hypothetical protein
MTVLSPGEAGVFWGDIWVEPFLYTHTHTGMPPKLVSVVPVVWYDRNSVYKMEA